MVTMKEVNPVWIGTNVGYIKDFFIIAEQDLISIDDPVNAGIMMILPEHAIRIKTGSELFSFRIATGSASLVESVSLTADGMSHRIDISFQIPKVQKAVSEWISRNTARQFIFLLQDHNGNYYISGSKEIPMDLTVIRNASQTNYQALNFSGTFSNSLYHLISLDPDTLFTYE